MLFFTRKKACSQDGQAFIELVMITPILIFFGIAGIEFSRSLNELQVATSLSRELASIAYRECAEDGGAESRFNADTCLKGELNNFLLSVQGIAPTSSVHVSMFKAPTIPGAPLEVVAIAAMPLSTVSKFSDPIKIGPNTALAQAAKNTDMVVVAEVSLPHQPIMSVFRGFHIMKTFLVYDPEWMYASTII